MMYNIKEKEKNLFSRWAKSLDLSEEKFCPNGGLLFKGAFGLNDINENNKYTWFREEGNEEEMWCKSPKRLMILTKDLNDSEGWDIREESGGREQLSEKVIPSAENLRYLGIGFYRKLNRWVFGILNEESGKYPPPPFEAVQDYKKMGLFYESAPLVRINCKREVGGSTVNNQVLIDSMNRQKKYLIEQIKLYHANIILCCGFQKGSNAILNFLIENNIYKDLELVPDTGNWIYFSRNHNVLVIDSYHPSATFKDKWMYEEFVKNYTTAVMNYHIKYTPLVE